MTNSAAKRRSPNAQLQAMAKSWPDFVGQKMPDGVLIWMGPLRPQAKVYTVTIFWKPSVLRLPYVMVYDPPIRPRTGGKFEDIPHLIFDKEDPEKSGLCLFDPEGNEWTEADLIADTTVHWASEWLHYYELWHLTGDWLAPSVGYESVGHMNAAEVRAIREHMPDVH